MRARCALHGLGYDPAVASGCVLCRRDDGEGPPAQSSARVQLPRPSFATAGLLVITVGGALAWGLVGEQRSRAAPYPSVANTADPPQPVGSLPELVEEVEARNGAGRSGWIFLPVRSPGQPLPLLVGLHGAEQDGRQMISEFRPLARHRGFAIVAPSSGRGDNPGSFTWHVADAPGDRPEDFWHVRACLYELLGRADVEIDLARVIAIGYSSGGSSAAFLGTTTEPYSAFAVLHGGTFPAGLGRRPARGWFSTGASDEIRTPAHVRGHFERLRGMGLPVTYREFPGDHALSGAELTAVVDWWLLSPAAVPPIPRR
ncbi:MAG: hypothetical protein FJ104_04285 [Deltaproteobacteria bacterium]|nr:hypothetical protein [Deltaproteobacteria bacterium]